MNDLDRAIAVIEESRQTHVNWEKWRALGHGTDEDHEMVGDRVYHEAAIRDYDHVLAVLRRFASSTPQALDVEKLALPWHRETVGHADIWQIARKIVGDLAVPLDEGLPPNTDATWIVNANNKVVAFVGNGPRQTDNAAAIIRAVDALARLAPSEPTDGR